MNDVDYDLLRSQLRAILTGETDALAAAGNFVALLFTALDDVNWLGIYRLRDNELLLGPFQGKPACAHIPIGKGVCGTAASTRTTQRVADVEKFAGHIVCDADSRSELVVPLQIDAELIGVLDIDSPSLARFTATDQQGIEGLCTLFCELLPRGSSLFT